jgi:cytochrome c
MLIDNSDCKSCHALDRKVNGPSFLDISSRYSNDKSAPDMLNQKIINGSTGNWGNGVMIPHPQLNQKEADEIVKWILSLQDHSTERVPKEGRYRFTIPGSSKNKDGLFVFHASINNEPGETIVFRPSLQQVEKADSSSGVFRRYKKNIEGSTAIINELKNQDLFVFKNIDLHGIKSIEFATETSVERDQTGGGTIELHVDGIGGQLLGSIEIPAATSSVSGAIKTLTLAIEESKWINDGLFHNLFFIIKNQNAGAKPVLGIDWVKFILK